MDDLISRQAAIDVAKQHWYKPDIAKALEELPSAQPKPKTGHWIYDGDQIICNRCFKAFGFISLKLTLNYCPNCGAKMIEPQ